MKMMAGFDKMSEKAFAKSGSTASEAVDNISTVAALGTESLFLRQYSEQPEKLLVAGSRKAFLSSIAYGASEIMQFSIWAIAL